MVGLLNTWGLLGVHDLDYIGRDVRPGGCVHSVLKHDIDREFFCELLYGLGCEIKYVLYVVTFPGIAIFHKLLLSALEIPA